MMMVYESQSIHFKQFKKFGSTIKLRNRRRKIPQPYLNVGKN